MACKVPKSKLAKQCEQRPRKPAKQSQRCSVGLSSWRCKEFRSRVIRNTLFRLVILVWSCVIPGLPICTRLRFFQDAFSNSRKLDEEVRTGDWISVVSREAVGWAMGWLRWVLGVGLGRAFRLFVCFCVCLFVCLFDCSFFFFDLGTCNMNAHKVEAWFWRRARTHRI